MAEKKNCECLTCAHGSYIQWMNNPIIAICSINKDRQVAEAKRVCKEYVPSKKEPVVTHYDSYAEGPTQA